LSQPDQAAPHGVAQLMESFMQRLTPLSFAALLLSAPLAMAQTAPSATAGAPSAAMAPQTDTGARPGNDIGTRSSLPLSNQASNITAADTKSAIAPTPPEPNVGPDAGVSALLTAANQSIAKGQTGTADEALEQAETQILQRSVPQTQTDYTTQDPVVAQIGQARTALGNHDNAAATQTINQILASNAPELND
jgi:hypothetical protein